MGARRKIDRKCLSTRKLSLNPRLSETPKQIRQKSFNSTLPGSVDKRNKSLSKSSSRLNASPKDTDNVISISELLKAHLKVFRVSPIYNFQRSKLRIYERKMTELLLAMKYNKENQFCECTFEYRKLVLDKRHDVIQVSVNVSNRKYVGYFISSTDNQSDSRTAAMSNFPVLLVKGAGIVVKQVHDTFCKFFDCDIHPVTFPLKPLITFFSCMSEFYIDEVPNLTSSDVVTLHCRVPGCPPSDTIKINMQLDAVATTCAAYNEEVVHPNKALRWYEGILGHLLKTYSCNFSLADLFKIVFPHFAISSDGLVKFSSEEAVKTALPKIEGFVILDYAIRPDVM
ncbi:UNVERIFIED_CONTAM: hypothetical protein PYX00_000924 [Menopon gallinae]|uniref:Centromere protein L n=1 Tax=Menopon gallinae TaxID=328185 RepID=A0AAW2IAZ6_9NEOP